MVSVTVSVTVSVKTSAKPGGLCYGLCLNTGKTSVASLNGLWKHRGAMYPPNLSGIGVFWCVVPGMGCLHLRCLALNKRQRPPCWHLKIRASGSRIETVLNTWSMWLHQWRDLLRKSKSQISMTKRAQKQKQHSRALARCLRKKVPPEDYPRKCCRPLPPRSQCCGAVERACACAEAVLFFTQVRVMGNQAQL